MTATTDDRASAETTTDQVGRCDDPENLDALIDQWELGVLDDFRFRHRETLERVRAERHAGVLNRRRSVAEAHIERRRRAGVRPRRVNPPRTKARSGSDRADDTPPVVPSAELAASPVPVEQTERPSPTTTTPPAPAEPPRERQSEFDSRWYDPPGWLCGINLRSWIVLQLADSPTTLTIAELAARLEASTWTVPGRLSKVISDALRCEVRRGRARRLARGVYAVGRIARTTKHRMRRRLHAATNRRVHTTPAPSTELPDATVEVRNALEFLLPNQVVARTRNATHIPTSGGPPTGAMAGSSGPEPPRRHRPSII